MTLEPKLIRLLPETWELIDAARGELSRAEWLEDVVWRKHRKLAGELELERGERPRQGQGKRKG